MGVSQGRGLRGDDRYNVVGFREKTQIVWREIIIDFTNVWFGIIKYSKHSLNLLL